MKVEVISKEVKKEEIHIVDKEAKKRALLAKYRERKNE